MKYVYRVILTIIIWIIFAIILRFSLAEYPGKNFYTYSAGEDSIRRRMMVNYTRLGSMIFDHDNKISEAFNIIFGILMFPASGTEFLIVNKNYKIGSPEYSTLMTRLSALKKSEIISATTDDIYHGAIIVELTGGKMKEIK